MELTPEQRKVKTGIVTGAIILGVVIALVAGFVAFLVSGNFEPWVRWLLVIVLGGGLGFLAYRMSYNSQVAKSVCPKCGTAFGIREVARNEQLVALETKEKVEQVPPEKEGGRATAKRITWTEEKVEVTAVDECSNCRNRTERKWVETREKGKTETPLADMGHANQARKS